MQTWIPLLAPLAVTVLLLVVPGLAVAVATGRRGMGAVLLAPALSTTIIATAAIVFGLTGLRWNVWMVIALALVACVLVLLGRWILQRRRARRRDRRAAAEGSGAEGPASLRPAFPGRTAGSRRVSVGPVVERWWSWGDTWLLGGLVLGGLLWARHMRNILGSPDAISQTFDNIFHLSAIRYILDTGDASALTLSSLNAAPGTSQFYPAAWHDVVSLVVEITGAGIPVASNAMLCSAVLVWVASCLFLTRSMLPDSPVAAAVTGVMTASVTAFPGLAMDFGVLYPNLLGIALAPIMIGLGIQLLRVAPVRRYGTGTALGLLVLVSPGVALAHPNAVMTVVVFATAAVLVRCAGSLRDGVIGRISRWWIPVAVVLAAVWLVVVDYLWGVLRPPLSQLRWEPFTSFTDAVGQGLLNAPLGLWPAWIVSILAVLGLYRTVRRRENLWLPVTWVLLGYCWLIVAAQPYDAWRLKISGVWYTDPYRVAMVLPLVVLPLAVQGALGLVELVTRRSWRRGPLVLVIAVVAAAALVLVTQRAPYMNNSIERIEKQYAETEHSALLTPDERALIERLPSEVPADAVVATDPWDGSSLAYPLADVQTTNHHALAYVRPAEEVLREDLNRAESDPAVCTAVDDLHVRYVLDFGEQNVNDAPGTYPGFDGLASAPGFELVDQQGAAKLYEITACGAQR
ncbi:hypothetical protein BRM3_05795 [Brachybacterium huguangmaarense]|uniref:Uncharacterized protein n=1 Tax=Brachybacterium huguangmaarense TaxID=1652028 RepID=A0ABY6G3Z1_9MICO|nr:DUF6541 family protein [Brachybacterium huguangmaarense]UYG17931.1 hypothetical protein BRM3_05795 [Brachybacterium huguangmaarense]